MTNTNPKTNALSRVLGLTILITAMGCGAGGDQTEACQESLSCSDPGTGSTTGTTTAAATTTPTDTTTGTTTSVATSTPTDTGTGTGTGTTTDTNTSNLPPWCNYGTYPNNPAAGLPLQGSVISNGTWHTIHNNTEWVLNCAVDSKGDTNCCGTLLSEATLIRAPSYSTWGGYSMEHCIVWSAGILNNTTGAPSISGTGYTFDETTSRFDLTGSTQPTWNPAGSITIAACQ